MLSDMCQYGKTFFLPNIMQKNMLGVTQYNQIPRKVYSVSARVKIKFIVKGANVRLLVQNIYHYQQYVNK